MSDEIEEGMDTEIEDPVLRWFVSRPQLVWRCVASGIATFFLGGLIAARTVAFADGSGTLGGMIAVDVSIVTALLIVLMVIWATKDWASHGD